MWAAREITLSEGEGLIVSELACKEPGCPPVETVIGVLGSSARRVTIHKQASEVTEGDVAIALSSASCGHDGSGVSPDGASRSTAHPNRRQPTRTK